MAIERTRQVREMFGRIVPRYDLLNRLMSLGMDAGWRRAAAAAARPQGALVLDAGAGTGDLTLELVRQGARRVVALDLTPAMLAAGRAKALASGATRTRWLAGDALRLPFRDATFDAVTNAFVLRNLADLGRGLEEMARVLRPGGRLVCLDMTRPRPGPFAALYRLYFHHLVPPVAGLISGDRAAYRYLPQSLDRHPDAMTLASMLERAGLRDVTVRTFAGGAVALHAGVKP
ncbi:MAG TPA: ubiquinone/menaquinone biosynthesis methyltransferase [Dehalococcoidia bacterium]|jgi:demethylmenaquinone methyltransferase/2-methoxy-6-polyprenyl-1,4-benzoquinol methylase|nr:ubiquinone/menaquinone biosynthesis methyltransferase [Dehalococcoidia bacterium]